jgi:hypothetical protein
VIRWLRPEFQDPKGAIRERTLLPDDAPAVAAGPAVKRPWPKTLAEQFRAIRDVLAEQPAPAAPADVARCFKSAQTKRVAELLATLESLGQARESGGLYGA